ncbi:MAG: long-chain fatty acid transport protein [Paracoccaceae bacterium]|jgi:long-chain fatty acid transport protein
MGARLATVTSYPMPSFLLPTDKWALHADLLWTNWSKFQSLDPKVNPLIDPALSKEQNWDDTLRFSIGTSYKHSDRLTLRAGLAYDESPVSTSNSTLRIPDSDRTWASIGASYVLSGCYTLDIGYTHIFADDVSLSPEALGGNTEAFLGEIEGTGDIFSIGLSGSF